MATGYLYAANTPNPSLHFTGYPEGSTTVQGVTSLLSNSQVQVDNQDTHHKLLITMLVSSGGGSIVVTQTMDGNSGNVTDLIGSSEKIIYGQLTDSQQVLVDASTVTVTLTTDGTNSTVTTSLGEVVGETIIPVQGVNGALMVTASGMVKVNSNVAPFSLKVEGNLEVIIPASENKFILQGAKTQSMSVQVPLAEPPYSTTVPGVYVECTSSNQEHVEEV